MICNFNNVTVKTGRSTVILTDAGSGATLKFYTGAPPIDASVAVTGTLLATLPCSNPFGTVTAGISGGADPVLTAGAITSGLGVATGTPGFARLTTSGSVGVVDLDCGASGGSGTFSIYMTPDTITSGAPVMVTSLTITEP